LSYTVLGAFDEFRTIVDADPAIVTLARERRDTFKRALMKESDVLAVWGSGSLRRSTQLQPVHDVDLVVEFDAASQPDWNQPGSSAADALEHAKGIVQRRLSVNGGTDNQLVRRIDTAGRNRSAKCFVDDPGDENAFTVDVMPALRQADGTIRIPAARASGWSTADPEYLIEEVQARQDAWDKFRSNVRLLKKWSKLQAPSLEIKSLVMEVLALDSLVEAPNTPQALRSFFVSASSHSLSIEDPAGHCGLIQPDLDVSAFRAALEEAAVNADAAMKRAAAGDQDGAGDYWHSVFGPDFPTSPDVVAGGSAAIVARPVVDSPQG